MKIFKVFLFNIIIFISSIFFIELIFGYWFDKNNLGPYMREHRMKKNLYSITYAGKEHNFLYKRNYYGFRGEEIDLEKINTVMIGGSTLDERYKPYNNTIVGNLNKKLIEKNIKLKIINAGIEGQSTFGHIFNFQYWFPKLENFRPKYFIFYIGINDRYINEKNLKKIPLDGHIENPSRIESIADNIKSRSIFYDLIRKLKHKYYTKSKRIVYDFDQSSKDQHNKKKFKFLNYQDAIKIYNIKELKNKNKKLLNYYLNNIDKLVFLSKEFDAKPIFINQMTDVGYYDDVLFILNYSLIEHCQKKEYSCIDLGKKLKGKQEFWWDGIHTTIKGSEEISDLIFPELLKFLKQ